MFSSFDNEKGILTVCKVPIKYAGTVYEVSDAYESYAKYRDHGLRKDIEEILLPELNKIAKSVTGADNSLTIEKYEVLEDNTASYKRYEYYSAFLSFGKYFTGKPAKFCIFKLPYMDEYGVINREGKQYALINELVQDDDITYNQGEMKIITAGGCFINLKGKAQKPTITFRQKNLSAHAILAALATEEGLDPVVIYNKLISNSLTKTFKNEFDKDITAYYSTNQPRVQEYVEALKSPRYSLQRVRNKMNRVLSIDRALGYSLAESIKLKTGEVVQSETIVTSDVLGKLKRSAINEVKLIDVPCVQGNYLVESVGLPYLRRGTELIEEIREVFPNEKGNYLNRDIKAENGGYAVIFPAGTMVRKGLLEVFAYNGIESVKVAPSPTSTAERIVPLVRTVVGNRCFTKSELDIAPSNEYVYVNEDGTYSTPSDMLTAYDMAAMISLYSQLIIGKDVDIIANRDLGLRKKVNMANESFHRAFEMAVPRFISMMKNSLKVMFRDTPIDMEDKDRMEAKFFKLSELWWQQLYIKMKLITRIDKSNPLSFYSSFAKINSVVSDKNAITMDQHNLSMGHYGRLCPYETPSSKTMGIVNNRAIGLKIEDGIMKTGYHPISERKGNFYVNFSVTDYLSVEEEEQYRIADITSLDLDPSSGRIRNTDRVIARVPSKNNLEKMDVQHVDIDKIDYVNIDPQQSDGIVATTIPFQGANDAARVIFGLSMAKQAKPCHRGEIPIVMTSAFYNIPRKTPYFMIQAEYDGVVVDAYPGSVTIQYYETNKEKTYDFAPQEFSKESVIIRELKVDIGDEVKAGDIIVTSNFIKDGYLATGVNVLVAYVPEGYNYEDGVYGSNRLREKLISYGSSVESKKIPKDMGAFRTLYTDKFRYKRKGSYLYSLLRRKGSQDIKEDVHSKHLKGFIVNTNVEELNEGKYNKQVTTSAVSFDKLNKGDKTANRHGNKGVTPMLCDNNDMPRFKNGEFVDMCYNPLGVPSRMNIGQVLECNLGLAGHVLGIKINSDSFNGATDTEIKELLSYAWDLANSDDAEAVFNSSEYSNLPKGLHKWCRERLREIRFWRGAFNKDGTAMLYNPRTDSYFETPVLVGINYVYKLVHVADKKMHARAGYCTEPYVPKLNAPPKGSSRSGGQRMGYMELDAIAAYGAFDYMHELLNERSDNYVARNNLTVDVLHTGDDKYRLDESTAIRRSTEYFVSLMEALGLKIDFEGELPNDSKEEIEQRECWRRDELIKAEESITPEEQKKSESRSRLRDISDDLSSIY